MTALQITLGTDGAVVQDTVIIPTPGVAEASCMYVVTTGENVNHMNYLYRCL